MIPKLLDAENGVRLVGEANEDVDSKAENMERIAMPQLLYERWLETSPQVWKVIQ